MSTTVVQVHQGDVISAPVDNRAVFTLQGITLSAGGKQAIPMQPGLYYAEPGDVITLNANIYAGGEHQEQLTFLYPEGHPDVGQPSILKLPLVRHAAGKPVAEEIYMNATIVGGVLTATGKIPPTGGDWKIIVSRCNDALSVIKAPFKFQTEDVSFIA